MRRQPVADLKSFQDLDCHQLFSSDQGLKDCLATLNQERLFEKLQTWEKRVGHWNPMANEASLASRLPQIEKYDSVGNPLEKVKLPQATKIIRRGVVEGGIFKTNSELEKFAMIYVLAQNGESGVTCPLACTDGLIRVIEEKGSDFLKKYYLPKLSSVEYPLSGAQFITEQSGGSDVGAIEGRATLVNGEEWSLTAEKWYCSAYDEFFCVAARPEGAPKGTAGLALFFVPRLVDGKPNNLSLKRLKNKLGTQSLPTGEVDFTGSKAYLIGRAEEGFHNLMNYVLNVSRIHNAANSLGLHRRSFAEARNYASQRIAFGKEIIQYPLIQEYLMDSLAHLTAKRNMFFKMIDRIDRISLLPENSDERMWNRFLINLLKYRTAHQVTEHIKKAILVFGANGVVEDFSIVPRLLRDALIVETWEGPHNTLCLQIMKDARRFNFRGLLIKKVEYYLGSWPDNVLSKSKKHYQEQWEGFKGLVSDQNLSDKNWVQMHAKRVVDFCGSFLEIGNLVDEGVRHDNQNRLLIASYLTHDTFLNQLDKFNNPVIKAFGQVGLGLIREENINISLLDY